MSSRKQSNRDPHAVLAAYPILNWIRKVFHQLHQQQLKTTNKIAQYLCFWAAELRLYQINSPNFAVITSITISKSPKLWYMPKKKNQKN